MRKISLGSGIKKLFKGITKGFERASRARSEYKKEQEKKLKAADKAIKKVEKETEKLKRKVARDYYKQYVKPVEDRKKKYIRKKIEELNKKAKERREKEKSEKAKKVTTPNVSNNVSVDTTPSETDMIWEALIDTLDRVYMGDMSANMPFYNPKKVKGYGNGRRQADLNAATIDDILQMGLSGVMSRHPELSRREAKAKIIDALSIYFGGAENIAYKIEVLAYGMYDEQYAKWGRREYKTTITQIKTMIDFI